MVLFNFLVWFVAVSTPPSASLRKKGICKFLPATCRTLSWESRVSQSNKLLYGTKDPQTRLDINTSSEGIGTFKMDQPTKKRQRNQMSEEQKKSKGRLTDREARHETPTWPCCFWNCKYKTDHTRSTWADLLTLICIVTTLDPVPEKCIISSSMKDLLTLISIKNA